MNDLIFMTLQVLVYVAIAAVCRYVIPYVSTKLKESRYSFLAEIIEDGVRAYEQTITGSGLGAKKKDMVTQYAMQACNKYGITIDPEQIEALIESAVQAMNTKEVQQ